MNIIPWPFVYKAYFESDKYLKVHLDLYGYNH